MKILVIGESCNDVYCYGVVNRLAPEAPVPVFSPKSTNEVGGMAMNVYLNVKSLGVDCDIITNDNWKSIQKRRFIDDKTNQMFIRVDTCDDCYGIIDYSSINFLNYDAIIISDYDKGFLSKESIEDISKKHKYVFLDTKKILGDWAKNSFLIKINQFEYQLSSSIIDDELKEKIITTLGSDGCIYNGIQYKVPKVDVKDVCGAGDTFIAALVSKFINKHDLTESIQFANECSTKVIQKRGTNTVN
jgi:D-beta-D-heptose 7-phosphate kinase/D-beta-D-heptose 1-phosphate adenosyltransferase